MQFLRKAAPGSTILWEKLVAAWFRRNNYHIDMFNYTLIS